MNKMRLISATLALLGGLLVATSGQAQIVNVQNLAGKAVKDGVSGNASVDFDLRAGNVQFLLGSAGFTTFYKAGANLLLLTAKAAYGLRGTVGEWEEEPFRERIFEHLRYRRQLNERWAVEGFVQHEFDRWRRLRLRALAGGGPRLDIPLSKDTHAAVGIAYMWQAEELLKPQAGDISGIYIEHRITSYITGATKLNEHVTMAGTAYLQPRIDVPSDIRSLIDGSLVVALTERLGLKLTYVIALDTHPPIGVRGYDVTAKLGFAFAI